ncbi:MAG: DUF192 domain-containing protein [Bdellovibrionales bacterium]
MAKLFWAVLLFIAVCGVAFYGHMQTVRPSFETTIISFQRQKGGTVPFNVELARTPWQLSYGLMFMHDMPPDEGMLFILPEEETASFWMKNTYIPLDLLFIRQNGVISGIAQGKPHDLTPIESQEKVRYVLEINAGRAVELGLAVGDRLSFKENSAFPL